MDPIKITEDFEYVLGVFESCKTAQQVSTAKQLAANFFEKYKSEFDSISRAHTSKKFEQAMNDAYARIIK